MQHRLLRGGGPLQVGHRRSVQLPYNFCRGVPLPLLHPRCAPAPAQGALVKVTEQVLPGTRRGNLPDASVSQRPPPRLRHGPRKQREGGDGRGSASEAAGQSSRLAWCLQAGGSQGCWVPYRCSVLGSSCASHSVAEAWVSLSQRLPLAPPTAPPHSTSPHGYTSVALPAATSASWHLPLLPQQHQSSLEGADPTAQLSTALERAIAREAKPCGPVAPRKACGAGHGVHAQREVSWLHAQRHPQRASWFCVNRPETTLRQHRAQSMQIIPTWHAPTTATTRLHSVHSVPSPACLTVAAAPVPQRRLQLAPPPGVGGRGAGVAVRGGAKGVGAADEALDCMIPKGAACRVGHIDRRLRLFARAAAQGGWAALYPPGPCACPKVHGSVSRRGTASLSTGFLWLKGRPINHHQVCTHCGTPEHRLRPL